MDLSLASMEDLLKELLGRFDHAVFMGLQVPGDGHTKTCRRWIGNSHTTIGLCEDLKDSILHTYQERENPLREDEL